MSTVIDSVSIVGLRKTHFTQLKTYLDTRDREEWYYGNQEQFQKRHGELFVWLNNIIELLNNENTKIAKK